MNTKKVKQFSAVFYSFLLISISAFSQNGFVITGTLSLKPVTSKWLPNDILVEGDYNAYDTAYQLVASGGPIKYVGDDIMQVQRLNTSWGYDPQFPYKVNLVNSHKQNVLGREFVLYYFGTLSSGMIPMGQQSQNFGFINTKGDTLIPFKFQGARSFSNGRAPVQIKTQEWTLIDEKGNPLFPPAKERGFGVGTASEFEKGFCIITEAWEPKKFSIASEKSFKPLIPYHGLKPEIISKYIIQRGNTIYLYNEVQDTATELKVTNFLHLGYGYFYAEENNVPGIYQPDGQLAYKKSPDYKILRFNGKVFNAYNSINKAYCLLDLNGKEIFSCTQFKFSVSDMRGLNNGYTAITADGIIGIIDEKGKLIVPLQFTNIEEKAFETSKFTLAQYNGAWVILRLKTAAELKTEQQLIVQKKMPTAEQCFAKAKESTQGQPASSSSAGTGIVQVKNEKTSTLEAGLAFITNGSKAFEEINKLTDAFNACTDGSGKGANGKVSDAALKNASAAKNAFLSAIEYYKSSKQNIGDIKYELLKPYFSNLSDYIELYKSLDKASSALSSIFSEESEMKTLIYLTKIEYTDRTYYDVWLNQVRTAATRYKDHLMAYAKEFENARKIFASKSDISVKAIQKKQ